MQKYLTSRHGRRLSLAKPLVMGILNVTPDSFSDGGRFKSVREAVEAGLKMVAEGADIIDVGGESTGPGSKGVPLNEELKRVIPVIEKLRLKTDAWISVDTWRSQVAKYAVKAGADMVNDVTALRGDPEMAGTVAELGVPVVLMYSKDTGPRTTVKKKRYGDVVKEISAFLRQRVAYAKGNGIAEDKCIIDPGMGAFISMDEKYSLRVLKGLPRFSVLGRPVLLGASRKSFIGNTLGLPVDERLEGGLACAVVAVLGGATIIRAHDVKETRRAVDMTWAVMRA